MNTTHPPAASSIAFGLGFAGAVGLIASGLAERIGEPNAREIQTLEAVFTVQQARFDLDLAKLELMLREERIDATEYQTRLADWLAANEHDLREQAKRAARLDQIHPLPPERGEELPPPASPAEADLREAQAGIHSAVARIQAENPDPDAYQERLAAWLETEGKPLVEAHDAAARQLTASRAGVIDPIVLEVPEDASAERLEALDIEEQIARRFLEVRARTIHASADDYQAALAAEEEYLAPLQEELARLLHTDSLRQLRRKIDDLTTLATSTDSLPSDPDSDPDPDSATPPP